MYMCVRVCVEVLPTFVSNNFSYGKYLTKQWKAISGSEQFICCVINFETIDLCL
jgi:hypothetical protein